MNATLTAAIAGILRDGAAAKKRQTAAYLSDALLEVLLRKVARAYLSLPVHRGSNLEARELCARLQAVVGEDTRGG